jgi:F-type H+-transporting ATPase subunit alpha
MNDFKKLLDDTGEVGYVEQVYHSILYISGLPKIRPMEVVLFETGEIGQVISLSPDYVEVLLLAKTNLSVGTKVARTGNLLKVKVGSHLLGKTLNPLGLVSEKIYEKGAELRLIDVEPKKISVRKNITRTFETGVSMLDLIVPLGKGQRELVVGDRKTGKTQLLIQTIMHQASKGMICVYGAIAKKRMDIRMAEKFFESKGVRKNTIIIATSSSDPVGLVHLTPYTAMTVAEYFRDSGYDVFVVLDDLSAHAKYYREIMLLAKRFPGRNSYPGDIFYIHSKLLERAGNFEFIKKNSKGQLVKQEVSITCLPVAELSLGDLSGYIQTNLMAMTDGHIFFDSNLYNQGRRPAINPFLSVTRVGRQAQSDLFRDINRQITKFLVYIEKLREFMHFGAELSESTRRTLSMGDRITSFFDQAFEKVISININAMLLSAIWGGYWKEDVVNEMKRQMEDIINAYSTDEQFRKVVDIMVSESTTLADLVAKVKENESIIFGKIQSRTS